MLDEIEYPTRSIPNITSSNCIFDINIRAYFSAQKNGLDQARILTGMGGGENTPHPLVGVEWVSLALLGRQDWLQRKVLGRVSESDTCPSPPPPF